MYLVLLLVDDVLWRDESLEHGWSLGSSLVSQRTVAWLLFGFGESLLSKDACDVWFPLYE
jgi:hypothetical protein